jgi:hypothetical protein
MAQDELVTGFQTFRRSRNEDGSLRKVRSDKGERRVPLRVESKSPKGIKPSLLEKPGVQRIKNGIALRVNEEKGKLGQAAQGVKNLVKRTFPSDEELKEITKEDSAFMQIAKGAVKDAGLATATISLGIALHKNAHRFGAISEALTQSAGKLAMTPVKKVRALQRFRRIRQTSDALDKADALINATANSSNSGLNLKRLSRAERRIRGKAEAKAALQVRQNKQANSERVFKNRKAFAKQSKIQPAVLDTLLVKSSGKTGDRGAQAVLREKAKTFKAKSPYKKKNRRNKDEFRSYDWS